MTKNLLGKILAAALAWAALASPALAQSSPGWTYGKVPTPAEWNAAFAAKQDFAGGASLPLSGGTMTGRLTTVASSAPASGFNLPQGVAPSAPNNGDLWTTSAGIFARINGVTYDLVGAPCLNCALTNAANVFTAAQTISLNSGALPAAISGSLLRVANADGVLTRIVVEGYGAIPRFTVAQAAGTAAAPTQVLSGTEIGGFNAFAWGSNAAWNGPVASMRSYASENITGTAWGSKLCLATTLNTTTILTDYLCVVNDGGILLNATTSNGAGTIRGLNSQNSSTAWQIENLSTGTAAQASLIVSNSVSSVQFGHGGSAFTGGASLFLNRGFVITGAASGGIVVAAGGANPLLFAINGLEVGRWEGGSPGKLTVGLSGTNTGQACLVNVTSGSICLNTVAGALGSSTATFPVGSYAVVGDTLAQTLTNKSIGAFTLGGTISGGGNQINNVVIGATTPLAGSFTSLAFSTTITGTSTSSACEAIGRQGATSPAWQVDCSVASQATGVKVTGAAAGGGAAIAAISSGTNENLTIDAKGSGIINIASVSTGVINLNRAVFLGVQTSVSGQLVFNSGTSGNLTINPPSGALGSAVWTLQGGTDTFVGRATTDTLTGKTIDTAAASNTFKINGTTVATAPNFQQALSVGTISFKTTGINFNSANTDNAVTITLPTGFTRYMISSIVLNHASQTLTTATVGIFTSTGGGGTTVLANSAITVNTASDNTANNSQTFNFSVTTSYTAGTLQIRVGTAQGAPATGDVTIVIFPVS